uniref:Peroxisomal membrane protein 2 n=1 Tax=Lygus hesperus TaxID=30085 RepID=A0A0A9WJ10_LYGHE
MSLSKSLKRTAFFLLSDYLQAIYLNPIRTKALTSCVIAALGNVSSQCASGNKRIDWNSVKAFGLFGLIFGGTVPHFFFILLEKLVGNASKNPVIIKLAIERLLYAPFYQFLSLYMLARFEGKNHLEAYKQMSRLYWGVLQTNWTYLTTFTLLNLWLVPPMLRVLVVNCIGFFWSIYLASARRKQEAGSKGSSSD